MTAAELGRTLEEIIHRAAQALPTGSRCLREYEIRTHFGDASLNGVDHWITMGTKHILIQDKWKESMTQQEVAQFLTCADRIRTRLPAEDTLYLVWASKHEPTSNSSKILDEHAATKVCCSINIESLARCVILQVCECLEVDCVEPLRAIPSASRPTPMGGVRREAAGPPPILAPPVLAYDETEEGRADQADLRRTIQTIMEIMRRVSTAVSYDGSSDVYTLWNAAAPKMAEEWVDGKYSKVDYTAFLKAVKSICCATSKKALQSRSLFLYVKLRKLSVELSTHAATYESKRKAMLTKKSTWARTAATFKAVAEPITEAEFKDSARHCADYWENRMNRITHMVERVPACHIDTAFWTTQCMA